MDLLTNLKKIKKIVIFSFLFFNLIFYISAQEWNLDFEEAKKIAAEKNRNIVLVFQGSDWCRPCMKLTKNIWTSKEFKAYAKENFVMLLADFPRKKKNKLDENQKKKNIKLIEKYHKQGYFPFIVVLDKDGKVLGKTGYQKLKPSGYIKLLSSF